MTQTISADDVRARVRELPELPQAVHEIRQALRDENLGLEAFAGKLTVDPAIVARILRAANSSFYGMSGCIRSVRDAVHLIGLRSVGSLVTTAALLHSLVPPKCRGFDFMAFWEHSLATAVCSQELARAAGQSEAVAFTAGLLHDIGRLALATYYPREFAMAIDYAREHDCLMLEAETRVLGIGHAQVGAWIAAHWNFAEPVSQAIAYHHTPPGNDFAAPATLADVVHTADGIVHALDLTQEHREMVPPLQLAAWARLRLGDTCFPALFERTQDGFDSLRACLS
jgi:putative nucleotidyltransferase with HDIG domain